MTTGTRIGIGIVGVLLLFFGWAARSLETTYSSLGYQAFTSPDGVTGAYTPDENAFEGGLEIMDTEDPGVFAVVEMRERPITHFTGPEEEAAFWIETRGTEPVFTGTSGEVTAWIAEQEALEDDFFISYALMIGGGLLLLGAVALGRR